MLLPCASSLLGLNKRYILENAVITPINLFVQIFHQLSGLLFKVISAEWTGTDVSLVFQILKNSTQLTELVAETKLLYFKS